jgi:hypothetical protein
MSAGVREMDLSQMSVEDPCKLEPVRELKAKFDVFRGSEVPSDSFSALAAGAPLLRFG